MYSLQSKPICFSRSTIGGGGGAEEGGGVNACLLRHLDYLFFVVCDNVETVCRLCKGYNVGRFQLSFFFVLLKLILGEFVVAICDLVHDVEAFFYLF